MSEVSIDIGRVVFDGAGVDPLNGESLAQMTESALQRLVEEQGLSFDTHGREVTQVVAPDGGSYTGDEQTAHELARALYSALEIVR